MPLQGQNRPCYNVKKAGRREQTVANIIAVVWDFDKTLVDGYMQDPIFAHFNVDAESFWREVDALPDKYKREQHVRVNRDTIYLNHFIRYAKEGKFPGLNNQMLRQFGSKLTVLSRRAGHFRSRPQCGGRGKAVYGI